MPPPPPWLFPLRSAVSRAGPRKTSDSSSGARTDDRQQAARTPDRPAEPDRQLLQSVVQVPLDAAGGIYAGGVRARAIAAWASPSSCIRDIPGTKLPRDGEHKAGLKAGSLTAVRLITRQAGPRSRLSGIPRRPCGRPAAMCSPPTTTLGARSAIVTPIPLDPPSSRHSEPRARCPERQSSAAGPWLASRAATIRPIGVGHSAKDMRSRRALPLPAMKARRLPRLPSSCGGER